MALALESYNLGESDEAIKISSSDECREATLALAQRSIRSLEIFSHSLDWRVYNSQEIYAAALKLATHSRYSQIRIIVKDSTNVVKHGSRLAELSQRLSSRVLIRKPPVEYNDFPEEFVIADEVGLLRRHVATRYEGELNFCEPLGSRLLRKYFDDCWEKSAPDPDLRRLHL
jgi:hypothetical protein